MNTDEFLDEESILNQSVEFTTKDQFLIMDNAKACKLNLQKRMFVIEEEEKE